MSRLGESTTQISSPNSDYGLGPLTVRVKMKKVNFIEELRSFGMIDAINFFPLIALIKPIKNSVIIIIIAFNNNY